MNRRTDIYDIAHEWANNTGCNASATSSNLFFAGGAIYSYGDHFMIAKHVWNDQNDHAVLFTERTYSRTTGKHVSIVQRASSHLKKLYVPDPALPKEQLFEQWREQMVAFAHQLGNARKPAIYLLEIQQVFGRVKLYADFFGYEIPDALSKMSEVKNLSQFAEYLNEERRLREVKEKKERRKRLNAQRKHLSNWRTFKIGNLQTYDGLDYLRLDVKTGQIETTQGVRFPLSAGHQLYQFIVATIAKGGCTNCKQQFMEKFTISEVNNKFIRVGCHQVTLKEIKLFAKQQGWQ